MIPKNAIRRSPISHHWGSGVAETHDGKLLQVGDHPEDPNPSGINRNIVSGVYGKARIRRPAVRQSYLEHGPGNHDNLRGKEKFVEVDWDVALDLVARELTRVKKHYGNQAIYGGSYGWASAGRFHHAQSQLKRFLSAFGGFTYSWGNYSYQAALVLMEHIVGNFRQSIKQATRFKSVAKDGELVVAFGGLPIRNAQVAGGGTAKHSLKPDLLACKDAGVSFISISPLRTDMADELEAEWLAPRPGSDTAIMLGIAYTLIMEGLHDQAFLDRYTVGFDTFKAYLLGENDGQPKTAEWAAEQSEIPSERIKKLAREMASKRTLICTAAGLQRADFGEQVLWMTATLAAMLGQIGLPGGGYGIAYAADSSIGTADRPFPWPAFPTGGNAVKDFIPVACITDMLLNPGKPYQYNGENRQYPDCKLVWWAGGNPFHHHQDLNLLHKAFQAPDTIIVNEINWTATARHADIVLPVATAMERNDFGAGTQDNAIVPMPRAIAPIGEAKVEYDIYAALEKRVELERSFTEGKTSDEWLDQLWGDLRHTAKDNGYDLPATFSAFLDGEIITFDDPAPEHVFLSKFRNDPDQNPLTTPSGRIEIFSETIAGFKYDDCPGHATWLAPREWLGNASSQEMLHLVSGQPETRLHSQYDEGEFSQQKKIKGREPILINPADAEKYDISSGDIVRVFNARGECLAGAEVTRDIRPGVVFLWTGAWYDPDFEHVANRDVHGNPNVLTHDIRTSRLSQGPASHSALVRIAKFEGALPPIKAYEPPITG
mgnify:CR=1 FL=1